MEYNLYIASLIVVAKSYVQSRWYISSYFMIQLSLLSVGLRVVMYGRVAIFFH